MNKKWDQADFLAVSKAVVDAINVIQTLGRFYGAPPDKMSVVELYSKTFSGKYTANQVVQAIKAWGGDKLPLPHEIENFINPAPTKITEAQFIQAQKDHERNNFDPFGKAAETIQLYHAQQADPYFDRRLKANHQALPAPQGQHQAPRAAKRYYTPSGQHLNPNHIPPAHRAGYRQASQYDQYLETTAHLRGNAAGA